MDPSTGEVRDRYNEITELVESHIQFIGQEFIQLLPGMERFSGFDDKN